MIVIRKQLTPKEVFNLVCETEDTGYDEQEFLHDYDQAIFGWWNHNEDRLDKWCLEIADEFFALKPEYKVTNRELIAYAIKSHMEDWMEEESERCSYDNAE